LNHGSVRQDTKPLSTLSIQSDFGRSNWLFNYHYCVTSVGDSSLSECPETK